MLTDRVAVLAGLALAAVAADEVGGRGIAAAGGNPRPGAGELANLDPLGERPLEGGLLPLGSRATDGAGGLGLDHDRGSSTTTATDCHRGGLPSPLVMYCNILK